MRPFDVGSTSRASLSIALKFAAYRAATNEPEGRDLFRAVVAGDRHPKVAELIKQLDQEMARQEPPDSRSNPLHGILHLYQCVIANTTTTRPS